MALRILVVDDDPDIRAFVRIALSPPFEVVEARDGLEALQGLDVLEPDLAIVDLDMPLMNGFDLCLAIRRHERFAGMPVLFFSGHRESDLVKRGYASGANLFIFKPIEPERLLRNIELTVEQSRPHARPKRYPVEEVRRRMASLSASEAPTATLQTPPRAAALPSAGSPPSGGPAPARMRPRAESPAPAAHPPPPAPSADAPRPRILVIDDDEDLQRVLTMTLEREFETLSASDGVEAIEKLALYQPDLLIADVMMPRLNGFQLLMVIRRNVEFGKTPILVASARATDRDRQKAMQLGATDFLAKPFGNDQLLERVRGIVRAPGFRIRRKSIPEAAMRAALEEETERKRRSAPEPRSTESELDRLLREHRERGR